MKAQDFITSLPDGLFTHFQGMEATGSFDYKLDFAIKKTKSTGFDSKLKRKSTNHKVWRGELEQTQWRICLLIKMYSSALF
jgi:hypothetical protein